MRSTLIALLICLAATLSAHALTDNEALNVLAVNAAPTEAATFLQGTNAVAAAGTPEQLVAEETLVSRVEILARKNLTTANTGNIYVGFSEEAGANLHVLAAGATLTITAPPGKKIDLASIYIDAATNADAVVYTAAD